MAATAIDLQPYASLIVNQISVPQDVANNARIALQRMLDI